MVKEKEKQKDPTATATQPAAAEGGNQSHPPLQVNNDG
jgi:hypothetical protein